MFYDLNPVDYLLRYTDVVSGLVIFTQLTNSKPMKLRLIIFLIITFNLTFSQTSKNETNALKKYSFYILKSYNTEQKWSVKYILSKGFVQEEQNYKDNEFRSVQKNSYDKKNNIIYKVLTFKNKFNDQKMDTLSEQFLKYDDKSRLVELQHITKFSVTKLTDDATTIEEYSDFDKNSKSKVLNRYSGNREPIFYQYSKENREFDDNGNLVKEEKKAFVYSQEKKSSEILKTEFLNYKYDKQNNLIEVKRNFEPKKELPYTGLDGLTIYSTENYEYEYNDEGLWLKKYLVIEGNKKLLEERIFNK